jgi:hypothetical protein
VYVRTLSIRNTNVFFGGKDTNELQVLFHNFLTEENEVPQDDSKVS